MVRHTIYQNKLWGVDLVLVVWRCEEERRHKLQFSQKHKNKIHRHTVVKHVVGFQIKNILGTDEHFRYSLLLQPICTYILTDATVINH